MGPFSGRPPDRQSRSPLRGSRLRRPGAQAQVAHHDHTHFVGQTHATRLAYAEVLADETGKTARAVAFFASYGITVERVLTDNGSPYRSAIHAVACRQLGLRYLRTRPRRPQTDRKAERFIRTLGLRRDLRLKRRTHQSP